MCSKPGCDKQVRAKGFCINHYSAATLEARKEAGYVPTDRRKIITEQELEDFWQFVKKEIGLV
jgi:hypothetical protein